MADTQSNLYNTNDEDSQEYGVAVTVAISERDDASLGDDESNGDTFVDSIEVEGAQNGVSPIRNAFEMAEMRLDNAMRTINEGNVTAATNGRGATVTGSDETEGDGATGGHVNIHAIASGQGGPTTQEQLDALMERMVAMEAANARLMTVNQRLVASTPPTSTVTSPANVHITPTQTAPPTPRFALTPGHVNDSFLDYSKPGDIKLYKTGIAALPTTFTLDDANVTILMSNLSIRASGMGWEKLFHIRTASHGTINMLQQHALITMDDAIAHVSSFIGTPTRTHQNDAMVYAMLHASIDDSTMSTMIAESDSYTINGHPSGVMFLAILIGKAEVNNVAYINSIRRKLMTLSTEIKRQKYNITLFNRYVKGLIMKLNARGKEAHDVIDHILSAYHACPDPGFQMLIQNMEEAYEDASNTTVFTPTTIMHKAENRYKSLVEHGRYITVPPTQTHERRITALQAEVDTLCSTHEQALQAAQAQVSAAPAPGAGTGRKRRQRRVLDKRDDGRPKFEGDDAWKLSVPKPDEPLTKDHQGKTFHFCELHGYWCRHTTDACRLTEPAWTRPPITAQPGITPASVTPEDAAFP